MFSLTLGLQRLSDTAPPSSLPWSSQDDGKDLFNSAPSTTKFKVAGVHLITILGAIGSIGFVAIVVFV